MGRGARRRRSLPDRPGDVVVPRPADVALAPIHEAMLWRSGRWTSWHPPTRYGRMVIPAAAGVPGRRGAGDATGTTADRGRDRRRHAADDSRRPGVAMTGTRRDGSVVATSMDVAPDATVRRGARRSARRVPCAAHRPAPTVGRPAPAGAVIVASRGPPELARRAAVTGRPGVERRASGRAGRGAGRGHGRIRSEVTHEGGRTRSADPYLGSGHRPPGRRTAYRWPRSACNSTTDTPPTGPTSRRTRRCSRSRCSRARWGRPEDDLLAAPDVDLMLAEDGPPLLVGGAEPGVGDLGLGGQLLDDSVAGRGGPDRGPRRADAGRPPTERPVPATTRAVGPPTSSAARRLGIPIVVVQHGVDLPR